jgi:hypothetical protein
VFRAEIFQKTRDDNEITLVKTREDNEKNLVKSGAVV